MRNFIFIFCRYRAIIFPMSKVTYISVEEAAQKWQIGERSVRNYCAQGRVEGALLEGKAWKIPTTAQKPDRKPRHSSTEETLHSSSVKRKLVLRAVSITKFRLTLLIIRITLKALNLLMIKLVLSLKQKLLVQLTRL